MGRDGHGCPVSSFSRKCITFPSQNRYGKCYEEGITNFRGGDEKQLVLVNSFV